MRLNRSKARLGKTGGFYNFELAFVGAVLMFIAVLFMPALMRAAPGRWVIVDACAGVIGLGLVVFDCIQYHRITRHSGRATQRAWWQFWKS
jgi:hypothetical protein